MLLELATPLLIVAWLAFAAVTGKCNKPTLVICLRTSNRTVSGMSI